MALQTTTYTAGTPSGATAPRTALNKTFYDRVLLETAKSTLVFNEFGQKRTIPKNSGKKVEFRRWNLFNPEDVHTLIEGTTPASQDLSQSTVEATLAQYGAFVEESDLLQDTAYDDVVNDVAVMLGEQLGGKIEMVARDALTATTNKQFAGGNATAAALDASDKLTVAEIRKAVRTLKTNKARMFTDGRQPHFVCICSPYATYDLQNDTLWQNVSSYSNAEQIYSGEIGRLFGVVFVESTETKVDLSTETTPVNSSIDVHHTLVFGADAYGVVTLEGNGNTEIIIKPVGSSGSVDPLNQRGTIAGKVHGYATAILQPLWIVDINHAVSA